MLLNRVHGPIAGFPATGVDLADGSGANLSGKRGQRFSKRGLPILANQCFLFLHTGATLRPAQGPPPPTQVKFTAFHDRSRIVNVYNRLLTFINVSFTTNFEKSRKLLSVGKGIYPPEHP